MAKTKSNTKNDQSIDTDQRLLSPDLEYAEFISNDPDYASDTGKIMYKWDGRVWKPLELDEMEVHAFRWLGAHPEHSQRATTKLAAGCALAAATLVRRIPAFESSNLIVLPLLNGYLHVDIKTGALSLNTHEKSYGLNYLINCEFDTSARAPKFAQFLGEVLPDEDTRNYVQEYVGYTLMPDCRHQKAMFWLGSGANGKSTLATVVSALHSKITAAALDDLDGFKLVSLIGSSLVYIDETPQKIDEQKLKSLISGGLLQIDRKFREPISLHPTAKWIICGNSLPAIRDQSHGFWRRLPVVDFKRQFSESEQDPLLAKNIVNDELSGVLMWALGGLLRLSQRGRFPVLSSEMAECVETGKRETNSVLAWWNDDRAEFDPDARFPRADVYADYRTWAFSNGMQALGAEKFWGRLRHLVGADAVLPRTVKISGRTVRVVPLRLLHGMYEFDVAA